MRPVLGVVIKGWPLLLLLLVVTLLLLMSSWPEGALVPAVLFVLAVGRLRDPDRDVPSDPLGVLSPVDGYVIRVHKGEHDIRLLLRVAWFGSYVLRCPTEGKVFEPAPPFRGLAVRTDEGEEVYLHLFGPHGFAPLAWVGYGERIGQGKRCGELRLARAVELRLPPDADLKVAAGERVRAAETVLARFYRPEPETGRGEQAAA